MSDGTHSGKPDDITLSEIITGKGAEVFWLPQCRTSEQHEARANLSLALVRFERVFGLDSTMTQLALWIATTKTIARKNAALRRAKAARSDINLEAAAARRRGDEAGAVEIESRPTPDYPEKASDEQELGYGL